MKRVFAFTFACVLLVSLTACNQVDGDYKKGLAALESGDYLAAYTHLSASNNERAANVLEKLVFVVTEKEEVSPDGFTYRNAYSYNEAGNLLKKESGIPGQQQTTEYTYDEKERLIKMQEDGDTPQTYAYTYDEEGNCIARRVDIDGTVTNFTYTYDEQGHCLTTKQVDADGSTFLTTNRYDAAGNKTYEKTDYADGAWQEQNYTYTADGKLLSESGTTSEGGDFANSYTYNEDGLLIKKSAPGGEFTYVYDAAGRLTLATEPDGITTAYTYDADGNCLSEKMTAFGSEYLTTYTYDEMGNRLSATYSNGEKRTFTYDENGNKTSETYTSMSGQETVWQFEWELQYYPDGIPEEVERIRQSAINMQPVM